jgi:hypothetical protein
MSADRRRELVSFAEYGRRRGWSAPYVFKLVTLEKLYRAVIWTTKGRRIDPVIADQELADNAVGWMGPASDYVKERATEANHERRSRREAARKARLAGLQAQSK